MQKDNLGEFKRGANTDIVSLPYVWAELDVRDGIHAADMEVVQAKHY